jgi:Holliday junction resolvase RusA-like endonuclease
MRSFGIDIAGAARPQGSKKSYVINGRAVLVESNRDLKKFRAVVSAVIQSEAYAEKWARVDRPHGARVIATFYFEPPKSWSQKKRAAALAGEIQHTVKPDIDKITRYLLDAITDAGNVWEDDSQAYHVDAEKAYGSYGHIRFTVIADV